MFAACAWESAAPIARPITLSLTTDLGCPPTPAQGYDRRRIGLGGALDLVLLDCERRCDAHEMVTEKYTHGHPASVLRPHGWRTAENSAAYLLPLLLPGLDLLDVGCGPGTITIGLASIVGAGHAVGVDGAASAVEAARGSAATAQVDVAFAVADAYELSFEDDRFDVVHADQLLQHLADPVAALQEMRRVCRPGAPSPSVMPTTRR